MEQQMLDKEFSLCSVPEKDRKSCFTLTMIWTGIIFIIVSMMTGGGLAAGLNFKDIVLVAILGNIFLSIIAVSVSIIASKTGLTFALMTRYSFGENGSRIASLFAPIINLGWYAIQASAYGHFVALTFNFGEVGEFICMALSAVVMGIFALKGIKAITILGYIAIPAVVFLSLATSMRAVESIGIEGILSYIPKEPIDFSAGITAVIGSWIFASSTLVADIMRYAKSTKGAVIATLSGLLGGNIFMIICGALVSIATNNYDLSEVLLAMGLIIPSLILMTTNIFTTNASNLYSTSLNLANSIKMDRKKIIFALLVISAIITLAKPYKIEFFFQFLALLGIIVPPLSGIILSDYFIVHKGLYPKLEYSKFVSYSPTPWIAWGISLILVYFIDYGLPPLNGIVFGAIIYPVLMKNIKKRIILTD